MPATKYPRRGGGSIAVAWRNIGSQAPFGEHPAPNALAAELIKARGGVLPASPGPDMYDWEPQR
jgi:hypothetical protein